MKQLLAGRAQELIAARDSMKITKSEDNGNIEVRVQWDSNGKALCVAEMKLAPGLTPDDFKQFF